MSTHEHFKPRARYSVRCVTANALHRGDELEAAWRHAQRALALGARGVAVIDHETGSAFVVDLDPAQLEVLR